MLALKNLTLHEMLSSNNQQIPENDLFNNNISRESIFHETFWVKQDDGIGLPVAIAPNPSDPEGLFADIATFHQNLSPISAYLHILPPEIAATTFFKLKKSGYRKGVDVTVKNYTSYILGEILDNALESGRDNQNIPFGYSNALQTLAFLISRSQYLYPEIDCKTVADRWIKAKGFYQLEPSKSALTGLKFFEGKPKTLENIEATKHSTKNEISIASLERTFSDLFNTEKETASIKGAYNSRISAFNQIVSKILNSPTSLNAQAAGIAFYCNMILPGSLNHFSILKNYRTIHTQVAFWYAFFASISPEFDLRTVLGGLCLKVQRDLVKPFNIEERPTSDVSFDELEVLFRVPHKTSSLKPKRARSISISLLPGVESEISFNQVPPPPRQQVIEEDLSTNRKLRSLLFEALELTSKGSSQSRNNNYSDRYKGKSS